MRLVLGLSLATSSAVWVLVDTADGSILAEEVVAPDSVHDIARAAALSVQAFDAHTEHDIEGIRLTWTDDACQQGIRLRTKLRLFGFETVATVSQEAAREGRNKTARHLAPHLTLAYGAARSDRSADESRSVFQRLAAQVPEQLAARVPEQLVARVPPRVAVASCAAAAAAVAVGAGLYAFGDSSPSEGSYTTAAQPALAQAGPKVVPAPTAAPPKPVVPWSVADPAAVPAPTRTPEAVAEWPSTTAAAQPEALQTVAVPDATTELELGSSELESVPATAAGVPHLSGRPAPVATPARAAAPSPGAVPEEAAAPLHGTRPVRALGPVPPAAGPTDEPVASVPPFVLPGTPLPPVLSSLFDALP